MILGFTIAQMIVGGLVGLVAVVLGLARRAPNDYTLGGTLLVELLLLAQVVVGIVAPLAGNPPSGDPLEFWIYLGTAVLMPPLAIVWALVERNRWSTVVLGAVCLAIVVMIYRMQVIWSVQLA